MEKKELGELMETTSEEILNILTSIKGLLILAERNANPTETNSHLSMISVCVAKLEQILKIMKNKIQDKDSRS